MKKKYLSPRVKSVEFKVENGYLVSGEGTTASTINFGGTYEYGGGEQSGLDAYDDGGNIFGTTI